MSEALTIRDCASLEEFANQQGVSLQVAADIINNAQRDIQEITKARARQAFHGKGINKLIEFSESEDPKTAIAAITLLGKLAGEFKAPKPVMVSFDDLLKKAQAASAGPLGGITQIREGVLVDDGDSDDTD